MAETTQNVVQDVVQGLEQQVVQLPTIVENVVTWASVKKHLDNEWKGLSPSTLETY